jgi:hypothetical protein
MSPSDVDHNDLNFRMMAGLPAIGNPRTVEEAESLLASTTTEIKFKPPDSDFTSEELDKVMAEFRDKYLDNKPGNLTDHITLEVIDPLGKTFASDAQVQSAWAETLAAAGLTEEQAKAVATPLTPEEHSMMKEKLRQHMADPIFREQALAGDATANGVLRLLTLELIRPVAEKK